MNDRIGAKMVAIIDYDAGNIKSVEKAAQLLGQDVILTRDKDKILAADHIILPGVGAFGDAMEKLERYDLIDTISKAVDQNIPFLGICLGLQLMCTDSEEAPGIKGLGLIDGHVVRIPEGDGRKIPQIGWNSISFPNKGRLFKDIPENTYIYLVHSYYLHSEDRDIVTAQTEYGAVMDVSVEKGNLFACQFHPEKSSEYGLKILSNFFDIHR